MVVHTSRNVTAGAITAVAVVAAAGWYVTRPDAPLIDPAVTAGLAALVTPIVERELEKEWQAGPGTGQRVACAVEPFGTEPPAAHTVAEVRVAYVRTLCGPTAGPTESVLPIVVHLTAGPRIEHPHLPDWSTGDAYTLFPERLHDRVDGGLLGGTEAAFQARKRERAGGR